MKKAKDAFQAARQRCNNPNHPSYPGYGALGIKFSFVSFSQFIADVGLPPNKTASLDRIDAHGHYEPGNIRWASKVVQALNKKDHPLATNVPLAVLMGHYENQALTAKERKNATAAWELAIRMLNAFSFSKYEQQLLKELAPQFSFSKFGWKPGQVRNFLHPESYFVLPSITMPGKTIILLGGPFTPAGEAEGEQGTLAGLGHVDVYDIVPDEVMEWMKKDGAAASQKAGALWIGQPVDFFGGGGRIEGLMLAIASRQRRHQRAAAIYPVLTVLRMLTDLGWWDGWSEQSSPLLNARFLYIPDMEIDGGAGTGISGIEAARLAKLIEFRAEAGRKTFVGVANINKVHHTLRAALLVHLEPREMKALPLYPKFELHVCITGFKGKDPDEEFYEGLEPIQP